MDLAHAVREISEDRSNRIINLTIKIVGFLIAIMVVGSWLANIGVGSLFTFFGLIMILSILGSDDTNSLSVFVKFENSEWTKIWAEFFESLDEDKPINELEEDLKLGRFIRDNSENNLPGYIDELLDHPIEDEVEQTLREKVEESKEKFDQSDLSESFFFFPYYKDYHGNKTLLERMNENYGNEEYEDVAFYIRKTLENSVNSTLEGFGGAHRNDHKLKNKIGTLDDIRDETHTEIIDSNTIQQLHDLKNFANPAAHNTDKIFEEDDIEKQLDTYHQVQEKLIKFNNTVSSDEKQEVAEELEYI